FTACSEGPSNEQVVKDFSAYLETAKMKLGCVKAVKFSDTKVAGKSVNGNVAEVLINITGDWILTDNPYPEALIGDVDLFPEGPCMLFRERHGKNQTVQRKMIYKKYDTG